MWDADVRCECDMWFCVTCKWGVWVHDIRVNTHIQTNSLHTLLHPHIHVYIPHHTSHTSHPCMNKHSNALTKIHVTPTVTQITWCEIQECVTGTHPSAKTHKHTHSQPNTLSYHKLTNATHIQTSCTYSHSYTPRTLTPNTVTDTRVDVKNKFSLIHTHAHPCSRYTRHT